MTNCDSSITMACSYLVIMICVFQYSFAASSSTKLITRSTPSAITSTTIKSFDSTLSSKGTTKTSTKSAVTSTTANVSESTTKPRPTVKSTTNDTTHLRKTTPSPSTIPSSAPGTPATKLFSKSATTNSIKTRTSFQTSKEQNYYATSTSQDAATVISSGDQTITINQTTLIIISACAVLVTLIVSITVVICVRVHSRNSSSVTIGSNKPYTNYSTVNRPRYRTTNNVNKPASKSNATVDPGPQMGLGCNGGQNSITYSYATNQIPHYTSSLSEHKVPQMTTPSSYFGESPGRMPSTNDEKQSYVEYAAAIPLHKFNASNGNNAQDSVPGHYVNVHQAQIGQTSFSSPVSVQYASVKRSLHPKPISVDHIYRVTTGHDSPKRAGTSDLQVHELHYADLDLPGSSRNIVQIQTDNAINRCQYTDVNVLTKQ
ncbi:mucin-5AC-like isoform X2 [Dreissena polymorpha]|uniref:mucin-5AC-like isoform X2 n=1 Tax=Dreissena polymorpha TaxID=45954 RepID=UPI0022656A52|nr:mucin-5AC-like isoform X2 [Dreissena polymorpha]